MHIEAKIQELWRVWTCIEYVKHMSERHQGSISGPGNRDGFLGRGVKANNLIIVYNNQNHNKITTNPVSF
jgi:hypothetical protein